MLLAVKSFEIFPRHNEHVLFQSFLLLIDIFLWNKNKKTIAFFMMEI